MKKYEKCRLIFWLWQAVYKSDKEFHILRFSLIPNPGSMCHKPTQQQHNFTRRRSCYGNHTRCWQHFLRYQYLRGPQRRATRVSIMPTRCVGWFVSNTSLLSSLCLSLLSKTIPQSGNHWVSGQHQLPPMQWTHASHRLVSLGLQCSILLFPYECEWLILVKNSQLWNRIIMINSAGD